MLHLPKRLQQGDTIRVIAPSRSMAIISDKTKQIAIEVLSAQLGLNVTFGKNVNDIAYNNAGSIEGRVQDIHEAFSDPSVDGILTVIGGYNSNALLDHLDYELIKNNPKILCGYSDITALSNAITQKTGMVTYSGPHFSTFGMQKGNEYTIEQFKAALFSQEPYNITPSPKRSKDDRYLDQEKREFHPHEGYICLQEGEAQGTLIGGNLNTLNLLQGTEYFPQFLGDIMLFIEDLTHHAELVELDRNIESLLQSMKDRKIVGLIIGKMPKDHFDMETFTKILHSKKALQDKPIIANVNFGHTMPIATLPIGGKMKIEAKDDVGRIQILQH